MAEKTYTPKVHQHLFSDEERIKWKVVDTAVVSSTSVTALLQNNQEWCIDTFDYDENKYKRGKRICLQTILEEPPLLLSYVHAENKLKHFVCTKTKLHLIDDESESIEKSVSLSAEPSALCVEDNKVYISTNETKTLMFFKLELPTDTSKIYLKEISEHDSIAEFVVHSTNIYVCTKGGKVSSHNKTGEKQHDYRNRKSKNSKARGLAVFTPQGKECNLLLVTWNDNTLYIYSTKTKHDLLDMDLNVPGKIRVTTSCFLMSSEVNDVAVYNMKTVADRGAFKMILVSGNRDKDLNYLYDVVLHDTTNVEALARNLLINRKTLRTLVKMYDYSCKTNDNLNAEKKKLKDEIDRSKKEKDDLTVELKNARSNLSRKEVDLSDVKAKLDDARTGRDELRIMNEEKEEKCCSLTKLLESEMKTTEELKDEIDRSKKEKDDLTKELGNTRTNLSSKEADLSDAQAKHDALNDRIKDLEGMKTELEIQQKKLKNNLEEEKEKEKVTCAEGSRVQVVTNLKEVEERNTKLEAEVTQLKERLLAEDKTAKEMQTSSLKVETNLKIVEERNTKLEAEVTQLKERLLAEENIAKEMHTSSLKLNERIKDLEDIRTELESQQKKLKDNLEEEKVTREEGSRVQLNERIKYLEGIRTKLESEQKLLKDNLAEEKRKVIREERSRVQATTSIEKLKKAREILEKEKEDLYIQLSTEKRNTERQKAALSKSSTARHNDSMKSSLLQIRKVVDKSLHSINEHQIIQVNHFDSVQGKDTLERRTSSRRTGKLSRFLPKMQRRYSREIMGTQVEKMQQEERGYSTDSTFDSQSTSGYGTASEFEWEGTLKPGFAAKIQHDKPGIKTDPATDHEDARSNVSGDTSDTDTVKGDSDEEESLDGQSKLEVCARVSVEGANLKIAETGVSLFIPPGALSEEQTIRMKIMPQPCDAKSALKFECNSVVVVELLPNNCRFQCPVSLTLPHCLQLKQEYERNSIDVLISHHDEGSKPKWEILHDTKFYLWKENCTMSLHSFCWVTYEIHDTIVEAKRIKLYTAGKKMRLKDRITEVEVGFYPDLPGSGKILELNKDMHLSQRKPYVFLKTGEKPLLINLHKVVPKEWNNSQPDENPKIIPFDSVSISEERSCPFVLERNGDDTDIPLCIFKVGQKGRNEVELTIRPEILTT